MIFSCNRLEHGITVDMSGSYRPCCLINKKPSFKSLKELKESKWYADLLDKQTAGEWPDECNICKIQEQNNQLSIRQTSNLRHKIYSLINPNYIVLEISPNNVCNSACQTCESSKSTFYAKLAGKKQLKMLSEELVFSLLTNDVIQLDLAGGEPLYSKLSLQILNDLPKNIKWLRINTNASNYFDFTQILENKVSCELTLSIDAVGHLFNYIRWPLEWTKVDSNIQKWIKLREKYPQLRLGINAVVSALNIGHLSEIKDYANQHNIGLYYSYLRNIDELNVKYKNFLTLPATNAEYNLPIAVDKDNTEDLMRWFEKNDKMRGISYQDYYLRNS
jgi:molybdenum cofactor biosynthesis enzyme MoaA